MPEYDSVSAELLEKSLTVEPLWRNVERIHLIAPVLFAKKAGSDGFTIYLRYTKDIISEEKLARSVIGDAAADHDELVDIKSWQEGMLKEVPNAAPYDVPQLNAAKPLLQPRECVYLFMSPMDVLRNAAEHAAMERLNASNGVAYSPAILGVKKPFGTLANVASNQNCIICWAATGNESAWETFRKQAPEYASRITKSVRYPSGTLYLPDLKVFEGRAEIIGE